MIRTGFKTDFAAKSSEKFVGKAAGGKGSSGVLRARREPFSPTTQSHGLRSRLQPKAVLKPVLG
jgi:hypothetical protein